MGRLSYSIAQHLGLDNDGRDQALVQYISQQAAPVRAALLIEEDMSIQPVDKARQDALIALSGAYPIDPEIMIQGGNPLVVMQQRIIDGISQVPAYGDNGTMLPVTTDFSVPNSDIYVGSDPRAGHFKWGPDGLDSIGTSYWSLEDDHSSELSKFRASDGKVYQKLSVIYDQAGGQLLWVRTGRIWLR